METGNPLSGLSEGPIPRNPLLFGSKVLNPLSLPTQTLPFLSLNNVFIPLNKRASLRNKSSVYWLIDQSLLTTNRPLFEVAMNVLSPERHTSVIFNKPKRSSRSWNEGSTFRFVR